MAIVISDTETREMLRRSHEFAIAYGRSEPFPPCAQIDEYMNSLLRMEHLRKPYKGKCPQRACRLLLIKFMMEIAEVEKLTSSSLYLAVYLLDRFMDSHSISETQLHLVTITCLIIAGKLEESDNNKTPKMRKYRKYIPRDMEFSFKLFTQIEQFILKYFDFHLLIPTESNFLDVLLLFALDGINAYQEIHNNNNDVMPNLNTICGRYSNLPSSSLTILQNMGMSQVRESKMVFDQIQNSCKCVLQAVLKREPISDFPASLIASAILLFARRSAGLNFWTEKLQNVSNYNLSQVKMCLKYLVEPIYNSFYGKLPNFTPTLYISTYSRDCDPSCIYSYM